MRRLLALALLASAPAFAGFSWRIQVTLDHTKVGAGVENESSFPVALTPSDASLKTVANGGKVSSSLGADILVFSDSVCSTQLPSELVWFDGVNGKAELWVNISTLSYTVNTSIYMCVGNASPPSRTTGVWDSNFVGVWHLPNGSSLTANDSTSNGNNSSTINSVSVVAGQIDGGASFNGTSSYIQFPNSSSLQVTGTLTISLWLNLAALPGAYAQIVRKGTPYYMILRSDNNIWLATNDNYNSGGEAGPVATSTGWHHYAGTVNIGSTSTIMYKDGAAGSTNTTNTSLPTSSDLLAFGTSESLTQFLPGTLDEVHISKSVRSAGWISTEYRNQSNPGNIGSPGFATFGSWVPLGTSQGYQILM